MARRNPRYTEAAPLQTAILESTYEYMPWRGTELVTEQVSGWADFWNEEVRELVVEGFGRLEIVETAGGEGQGDHAHIVFKLTDDAGETSYYKVDGYYSSYDGVDWDGSDLYAVTPRERVVTFYE